MWVYLNSNGVITSTAYDSENFYQNSVGVAQIYAYREDVDLSEYSSVKIQFKYSDNTYSPEVNMVKGVEVEFPSELSSQSNDFVVGQKYNVCAFYFNTVGYLGVAGTTLATITYYKDGVIDKTATLTFYIADTIGDEEQTITTSQYAELQQELESRWKRVSATYSEIVAMEKDIYTLYYASDKDLMYIYNGSALVLISGQQNLFVLTHEEQMVGDYYKLVASDVSKLIELVESDLPTFIVFEFSGGDFDGRRYLVNYNYNEDDNFWDFVCIDITVGFSSTPSRLHKFKLSDVSDSGDDYVDSWSEVIIYSQGKELRATAATTTTYTVYYADGTSGTITGSMRLDNVIAVSSESEITITNGIATKQTIIVNGSEVEVYLLLTDCRITL